MFSSINLKANAKINFCLDIIGVRDDGYHLIESVMQSIDLCDNVSISKTRSNIVELDCDGIEIASEKNTAYKAAVAFLEQAGIRDVGVKIKIKKNIPERAGMGGASADAAAVLVGLNRLFKTDFSERKLCEIGAKIGADVPFCIMGGTVLVRGIGEILTQLDNCADCYIVIVKGNEGVSTKEAYEAIDSAENLPAVNVEKVISAITKGDFKALSGKLVNVFEQCTDIKEVNEIVEKLRSHGAIEAAMTGSGSAVFGIFTDKIKAKHCVKSLKTEYPFAFLSRPAPGGVE